MVRPDVRQSWPFPKGAKTPFGHLSDLDLDKELGGVWVFKGSEDYEVVVEFDVRGRLWHASQELIEHQKGVLTVKMRLNSLEEIERWILGFGDHAEVIGPSELKKRVRKSAERIAPKYLTANSH